MHKISFKTFRELLELNTDKKYVVELLDTVKNSDCLFHAVIQMANKHIADLYKFRLKIAKETSQLPADFLNDYHQAVSALQSSQSREIGIAILYSEQFAFVAFYEPITKAMLGVLKSKNPSTLAQMEERHTATVANGLSCGFQKFSKGALIKDWS